MLVIPPPHFPSLPKVEARLQGDYYDIYFLVKKAISIKEIYKCGLKTLDGINFKLFAIALVYVDDIEDDNIKYLEPIEDLNKLQIRDFFQEELKKIDRSQSKNSCR